MYAPFGGWPEGTHATTCPRCTFLVTPRHAADPGIGAYIATKGVATYAPPAELVVERADKGSWHFETELFTNGYKIFQFVVRPVDVATK